MLYGVTIDKSSLGGSHCVSGYTDSARYHVWVFAQHRDNAAIIGGYGRRYGEQDGALYRTNAKNGRSVECRAETPRNAAIVAELIAAWKGAQS